MHQKNNGGTSDSTNKDVKTKSCPKNGDNLPAPKRGAFPTPKEIIKSAPSYIPENIEISGESIIEPILTTKSKELEMASVKVG